MSTSRDSCCLPSVKKQKHDFQVFAFVQCIIKQLLDSVFVISRIIKVSVRVISLSLRLRLITLTSTLIILDITKTSSNNCLIYIITKLLAPATSKMTNRGGGKGYTLTTIEK